MSDSLKRSLHDNPNAPKISSQDYLEEKANFAGLITCAIFYGIVVILFFQCLSALLNPVSYTKGRLRWLLVIHIGAMFTFVTVFTAINLNIISTSYIDNRKFPNDPYPGPLGYQVLAYSETSGIVSTVMFLLNSWLADGLLLYRCYIIYPMNRWAIVCPCLIYLASIATGIVLVYYQITEPTCFIWRSTSVSIGVPYSISVSLNVFLTLMIIARLVLLTRRLQKAMNAPFRLGGLYRAVITVVSESSAIYAAAFLLFIGTWAADNPTEYFFFPVLAQAQVIAPFLTVLRVANRKPSSNVVVSGDIGSIRYLSRGESTVGGWTPHGGNSVTSTDVSGETIGEPCVEAVTTAKTDHDGI